MSLEKKLLTESTRIDAVGKSPVRSERIAILTSMLLPLLASLFLFFNDYQRSRNTARYFAQILRYEILKGSIRDASFQSQQMVMQEGPFFRIAFIDDKGQILIDQLNVDSLPWLKNTISQDIYYSNEVSGQSAGTLHFSYSLQNVVFLSMIFFLSSGLLVAIYLVRQRKDFARKLTLEVMRQRNEAIARTVNSIAHDLRAPLNLMEMYIQKVQDDDSQDLRSAKQGAQRIHAMIESLRWGELENIIKPSYTPFDASYVIQLSQSLAIQRGKKLIVRDAHEVLLAVDRAKFERVIQNLLVNAIEAAKFLVIISFSKTPEVFRFIVQDDGSGVDPSFEAQLFQRGSTFGKVGGSGLGLHYCRMVIEGHGGSIRYERKESWTSFVVELPSIEEKSPSAAELIATNAAESPLKIAVALSDDIRAELIVSRLMEDFPKAIFGTNTEFIKKANFLIYDDIDRVPMIADQGLIFMSPFETMERILMKVKMKLGTSSNGTDSVAVQ